jgi:hypothetical protein
MEIPPPIPAKILNIKYLTPKCSGIRSYLFEEHWK